MIKFEGKVGVFKIKDGFDYVLQVLSKEEVNKIDNLKKEEFDNYPFDITDVITYGDTSNIKSGTLSKLIDIKYIHVKDAKLQGVDNKDTIVKHYECFSIKDYTRNTRNPIHVDYHSSWNCLMQLFNNPKYVIIYKVPHKLNKTLEEIKNVTL